MKHLNLKAILNRRIYCRTSDKRGIEYDNLLISAANSVARACMFTVIDL